jgi:competence protein ComEC
MHRAAQLPAGIAQTLFAALLAWVLGATLQLQQPTLWDGKIYALIVPLALCIYAYAALKNIAHSLRLIGVVLAMAALGFGVVGLRAALYLQDTLHPALEGRDLMVTGVVANLPQRSESGQRFRLAVESASLNGQPVALPPRIDVGWYTGAWAAGPMAAAGADNASTDVARAMAQRTEPSVADVTAGERWRMVLRPKAPHGSQNPHGFDYELWLWEQSVQATAYVRATAKDPAPVRLGQTWRYPVAWLRQIVRARIAQQVADRPTSGMLAALVVGDQAAIERWWLTLKFCSGESLIHKAFRHFRTFVETLKVCSSKN